jgi:hypothetical protein
MCLRAYLKKQSIEFQFRFYRVFFLTVVYSIILSLIFHTVLWSIEMIEYHPALFSFDVIFEFMLIIYFAPIAVIAYTKAAFKKPGYAVDESVYLDDALK